MVFDNGRESISGTDASPPRASPMIRVEHVIYDYPGHRALDDVSFALPPASVTALVGPNGAGKTTLLRNLAALDEPMSGSIVIDGLDVRKQARQAHRLMGYLPDHFGLYQDLSARRCLMYAAYARGLDEDAARAAAEWAARQVDLLPQLEMRAGTLSRGQRQRLALAQAIAHRPRVLLLDEPASGLDPQARAALSSLMKSLAADGMTLLISSHILAELESYCTAMLVLERGRLLAHQTLRDTASETNPALQRRVLRVRLAADADRETGALKIWAEARGLRVYPADSEAALLLEGDFDDAAQLQLLRELLDANWKVLEFAGQTRNLQNVYLQAVGQREDRS
ncbi:MAG: ABC transporter ATP-binding protein [Candidatus Accumulibacter sp.]|jgi:ABC-2 type transport system ATP-binding protein|nr:ABC transporter ATP-binding protein [Accumulibacter sp.]